jgi:hypothetical protein
VAIIFKHYPLSLLDLRKMQAGSAKCQNGLGVKAKFVPARSQQLLSRPFQAFSAWRPPTASGAEAPGEGLGELRDVVLDVAARRTGLLGAVAPPVRATAAWRGLPLFLLHRARPAPRGGGLRLRLVGVGVGLPAQQGEGGRDGARMP